MSYLGEQMPEGGYVELDVTREIPRRPIRCETMAKLFAAMEAELPCPRFTCFVCGKVRSDSSILDPGVLHFPRTCAAAKLSCSYKGLREVTQAEYWPGSLVLATLDSDDLWPAIVEFSTDEIGDYCLRRSPEAPPYAYYVTFIGLDEGRRRGGWFSSHGLKPLRMDSLYSLAPNRRWTDVVLGFCKWYIKYGTLRQRLMDLSHIVSELRADGFQIGDPVTSRMESNQIVSRLPEETDDRPPCDLPYTDRQPRGA